LLAPELGKYNHLVERIQSNPNLRMSILDIFQVYKENPKKHFSKSDTHWTSEGRSEWLKMINQTLEKTTQ
jgi:hypothetical protein